MSAVPRGDSQKIKFLTEHNSLSIIMRQAERRQSPSCLHNTRVGDVARWLSQPDMSFVSYLM